MDVMKILGLMEVMCRLVWFIFRKGWNNKGLRCEVKVCLSEWSCRGCSNPFLTYQNKRQYIISVSRHCRRIHAALFSIVLCIRRIKRTSISGGIGKEYRLKLPTASWRKNISHLPTDRALPPFLSNLLYLSLPTFCFVFSFRLTGLNIFFHLLFTLSREWISTILLLFTFENILRIFFSIKRYFQ